MNIIEEITPLLGDKPFINTSKLIELGLFNSTESINKAIKLKNLPAIRTSSRYSVIAKSTLLDYLKKQLGVSDATE